MSSDENQNREQQRSKLIAAYDTPEKRIERLGEIQMASMAILQGNPAAYHAYLKRNYATRRMEFVNGTWKPVARP